VTQRQFKFTEHELRKLPLPERGRQRHFDAALPGLCVRVTSNGIVTFGVYKRLGRKVLDVTIGRWPQISISAARDRARQLLRQLAEGTNPNVQKQVLAAELTLGELYSSVKSREFSELKSISKYDSLFRCHLQPLSRWQLSEITREQVQQLHTRIGQESGPYAANRALALLRSLFSKARHRGFEKPSPANDVRMFREKTRARFVQPQEAKKLFDAIFAEPNATMRDYLLLSLLCGARRANMLAMQWGQLDLERATWCIPDTKNGEPQVIPLVPLAIRILRGRVTNGSLFVFESANSKSGHIEEPKNAWRRVLKVSGLTDLRIHDLRRTFGSWQAIQGSSIHIVGKSLNHKSYEATQIYARLSIDPIRESVERGVTALLNASGIEHEFPDDEKRLTQAKG